MLSFLFMDLCRQRKFKKSNGFEEEEEEEEEGRAAFLQEQLFI